MALDKIKIALFNRLESLGGLPPIYYTNVGGEPTGNHIIPTVLPARTNSIGLREVNQEIGIFQVSIVIAKGQGQLLSSQIAELIINGFPRNLDLTDVRIDRRGSVAPSFFDGNWEITPVSIDYQHIS